MSTRTKLSDVNFQSNVFKDTLDGEFTNKLEISNGLIAEAPDELISPVAGYTQEIPKWNTISGSTTPITTSSTVAYGHIDDYTDKCIWIEREIGWSAEQILMTVAGRDKDATEQVAGQLGMYLASEIQRLALKVKDGVFATALASTHVKNDTGNTINPAGIEAARLKLGDYKKDLTNIVMHSKVESDALLQKILTYDKAAVDSYVTGNHGNLLGMTPFVDDDLVATDGVYETLIGAKGAIVYKFRPRPTTRLTDANLVKLGNNVDLELVRTPETAGGIDNLILRFSVAIHIPGVAWNTGNGVSSNPTDAQLATGANWTKVAPTKLIRLVQYLSN
jgi:hypothetical protein